MTWNCRQTCAEPPWPCVFNLTKWCYFWRKSIESTILEHMASSGTWYTILCDSHMPNQYTFLYSYLVCVNLLLYIGRLAKIFVIMCKRRQSYFEAAYFFFGRNFEAAFERAVLYIYRIMTSEWPLKTLIVSSASTCYAVPMWLVCVLSGSTLDYIKM